MHDRLARRENPLGIGVAGGVGQVQDDVLLHFLGRSKPNAARLPMFSLMILWPSSSICLRVLQDGAANVVADVRQFGGFLDVFHEILPAWRLMACEGQRYNPTLSHGAPQFRRAFRTDNSLPSSQRLAPVKLHLSNPAGLNLFTAYGEDYVAVNKENIRKT